MWEYSTSVQGNVFTHNTRSCTLDPVRWILYTGSCTLDPVHWILYTGSCTLDPVHWILYTGSCTLDPVLDHITHIRTACIMMLVHFVTLSCSHCVFRIHCPSNLTEEASLAAAATVSVFSILYKVKLEAFMWVSFLIWR